MDKLDYRREEIRHAREAYLKEVDRINSMRIELQRDEYNASRALELAMLADDPSTIVSRELKRNK